MSENIIADAAHLTENFIRHNHFHVSYELIYVKTGSIVIDIDGRCYTVSDETILFINCFEQHSIKTVLSEEYERYYVNFSRERIDKLLTNPKLASILRNRPDGFCHCLRAPKNCDSFFNDFIDEYQNPSEFAEEYVVSRLTQLLILLYRQSRDSFSDHAASNPVIYEIQNYIDDHFCEELDISSLAEKFFISKYYLSHSFKEVTGYSPKQYLQLNRLSYAKTLLLREKISISETAIKSGFNDVNNFIRAFKKEFGFSPNRFRKNALSP